MNHLPLTYAVFFHAIILPNTTSTQVIINNILFTGEPDPSEHQAGYFSTTIGSGYTSGAKNISKNLIDLICDLSIEELTRRISLIKLQDIPATFNKLVSFIKVLDLSDELKNNLLSDSANTDMLSFIAQVFQLSIKGVNEKLRLNNSIKQILHNPDIDQIISSLVAKSIIAPSSTSTPSDITDTEPQEDIVSEPSFKDTVADISDAFQVIASTEDYQKWLKKLQKEWGYDEHKPSPFKTFRSPHMFCQELILPRDFNLFVQVIGPLLFKTSFINLDFEDIHTAIGFDPYTKKCVPGKLMLLDALCPLDDYTYLELLLQYVASANNCIMSFAFPENIGFNESIDLSTLVSSYLDPDAIILYGIDFDQSLSEHCSIQLLCLLDESVFEANRNKKQETQKASSSSYKAEASTKKTLEIPSFFSR